MNRKNRCLSLIVLFLFLTVGLFAGCSAPGKQEETAVQSGQEEGTYRIYTVNKTGTKLTSYTYRCRSGTRASVSELLDRVKAAPEEVDQTSAMPENLYVLRFEVSERVLYLYFDGNYRLMTPSQEVLCRAALAKTMTQLSEVDYISIYVDDQQLADANGSPIGYVTGSDFIERISDVEDTASVSSLTLYFTDESGTKLAAESREVQNTTNQSQPVERMVVNELLAGPKEEGHYATIPSSVKVNSVQTKNGICYVNLDSAFVDKALNVSAYIPVYSLVNSLTELPGVAKVQIMINGNSSVTFRGSISFENPLERKLEYVQQ